MLSDEWQRSQFQRAGNDHLAWVLAAEEHLAASQVLKNARTNSADASLVVGDSLPDHALVHPIELMLRGLAVECFLKALWVKRGGKIVSDEKYEGVPGANDHNLLQLLDVNGMALAHTERNVLKRLSLFITFAGRYPVPKRWMDTGIQNQPNGGKGPSTYWVTPSDYDHYDSIIRLLRVELGR